MILNDQPAVQTKALADHISAELDAVCACHPDLLPGGVKRELAQAVAAFVRRHHGDAPLPSAYLSLLISRALWSIGEERAARRFSEIKGAELRFATALADAALAADVSLPHWQVFVFSRVVQPSSLNCIARRAIWILDLEQIAVQTRLNLELAVFRAINVILEKIAGVWDQTGGRGVLALRNLRSLIRRLGRSDKCRANAALASEVREFCVENLRAAAKRRGWADVPDVIALDL